MRDRSTRPTRIPRRRALKTLGAAGAAGLAGCTSLSGGGSGDNTVVVGSSAPLSGAYAISGERIRNEVELAGEHAVEDGDIDGFDLLIEDNGTDPAEATRIARQQLDDGADYIVAGLSGQSTSAVARVADREGAIHLGSTSVPELDTEQCFPNTFKISKGLPAWGWNTVGYGLENGFGDSVYEIALDAPYPQSMLAYNRDTLVPGVGGEHVGSTTVPFSANDFSQALTEARESGADIVNFVMFGGPLLSALKQADEFGYPDDGIVVSSGSITSDFAEPMIDSIQTYDRALFGIVGCYYGLDTPANNTFVEQYRDAYDSLPGSSTWYQGTRTLLAASGAAGTTDTDATREALRGRELTPQLFDTGERFRACDNRMTIPSLTVQGRPLDEVEDGDFWEVVDTNDDLDQIMWPCDDIACETQSG